MFLRSLLFIFNVFVCGIKFTLDDCRVKWVTLMQHTHFCDFDFFTKDLWSVLGISDVSLMYYSVINMIINYEFFFTFIFKIMSHITWFKEFWIGNFHKTFISMNFKISNIAEIEIVFYLSNTTLILSSYYDYLKKHVLRKHV